MYNILELIRNSGRAKKKVNRPVVSPENSGIHPNLTLAPLDHKGSHHFDKTHSHPRDRVQTAHLPIRPPI